jgi:hypothetical protein
MNRLAMTLGLLSLTTAACASAGGAEAQRTPYPRDDYRGSGRMPMVSVWMAGGTVLRQGQRAHVSFRADRDAYVTVVRIDTDGRLSILYPASPYHQRRVRGGATYQASGPRSFRVDDRVGLGYVFAIASDQPFDYSSLAYGRHWSYGRVRHVRYDPFEAMHDLAEMIMWDRHSRYSMDYAEYHVGRRVPFPRYMCIEIYRGDPYAYPCRRFATVYRSSPYRYGHSRYYGYPERVVYVREPVRYQPIEQKSAQQPPSRVAPSDAIERRRRDGDDGVDQRRSVPANQPRRVERDRDGSTGTAAPAPRREVESRERSEPATQREDPRAAPRRAPESGETRAPETRERTEPARQPAEPGTAPRSEPEAHSAEPRSAAPQRPSRERSSSPPERQTRERSSSPPERQTQERSSSPPERQTQERSSSPPERQTRERSSSPPERQTQERREGGNAAAGASNAAERRRRPPE